MASNNDKVLGFLPRNFSNVLVGSLIVTVVVALIWSWVEAQSFSYENHWVLIIEILLGAAIVGYAVGMLSGNASRLTLWLAAGFAALSYTLSSAFVSAGGAGAGVDTAFLGAMGSEFVGLSVSAGLVVLAIVGSAAAVVGAAKK